MIKIRMYQEKWRIEIENEVLEFKTKAEFKGFLDKILEIKEKYGRIIEK